MTEASQATERILLLEDDHDTRETLAELLRGAGYDVDQAGDGREGLEIVMRALPSVIITDCTMPHLSGPEFLERLTLDQRLRSIPAIVVSAMEPPPLPSNALVFLAKPCSLEQILEAVRDCLARARITRP